MGHAAGLSLQRLCSVFVPQGPSFYLTEVQLRLGLRQVQRADGAGCGATALISVSLKRIVRRAAQSRSASTTLSLITSWMSSSGMVKAGLRASVPIALHTSDCRSFLILISSAAAGSSTPLCQRPLCLPRLLPRHRT